MKNTFGILIEIPLNLYFDLDSLINLTIFFQSMNISFHLIVSSSVSFISDLIFIRTYFWKTTKAFCHFHFLMCMH